MTEFPITDARGHDLLREVMAYIETQAETVLATSPDDPSQIDRAGTWYQQVWGQVDAPAIVGRLGSDVFTEYPKEMPVPTEVLMECGTAMCLAGHTALMAGDSAVINIYSPFNEAAFSWVKPAEGGSAQWVPRRAQELLGLSDIDAERLFHEHNTLADLRRLVDQILTQGHTTER